MRLFVLLAAFSFSLVGFAQETSKDEKTDGLKKISSDRSIDADIVIDMSAFSSLPSLESLEALQELEGLEGLQSLEALVELEGLESLEALEALGELEIEVGAMHALELMNEVQVEVMQAIDVEAIVDMSLDIATDVLQSMPDIDVRIDTDIDGPDRPRYRKAEQ
ncbi:MAG: hypothetical protein AAGA85_05060 [Bacteroidota bacterium]